MNKKDRSAAGSPARGGIEDVKSFRFEEVECYLGVGDAECGVSKTRAASVAVE